MKVDIVEWRTYCTWHWDLSLSTSAQDSDNNNNNNNNNSFIEELCGICRVSFDGSCPSCKYPGDECPVILGTGCTHNFHLHCILKWLEQESSRGLCPMCRQIFDFQTITDNLPDEIANLKSLVDGHRVMRERLLHTNEPEFETMQSEANVSM